MEGIVKKTSMCRACTHHCRVILEVEDGRLTKVSGDHSDPLYKGFSCIRGISQPAFYNHPDRLLHALKRGADGEFRRIPLTTALDEIAERLTEIQAQYGPRAIASYWGTMIVANAFTMPVLESLMAKIGTPMRFNPGPIDKPGRNISQALAGTWQAPVHGLSDPDAVLLVGINPLTSLQGVPMSHPGRWFLDRLETGLQLFVIDPRRSDVARRATIHLQNRPGTDAAIVAAMLRLVLHEGLHDAAFIAENVSGFEALSAAVEPFTPERAAAFADVSAEDIVAIARGFAEARRATTIAGTGPAMSGSGTLVNYLLICLDTVLGHYLRAGDQVRQPGVLQAQRPAKAQANPPKPGYGFGELMRAGGISCSASGLPVFVLPDEMLLEDEYRVRALLSASGNPANAWPDQQKTVKGLKSLDLLVQIDPWMSETAQLAHYVLPPKLAYETPCSTGKREFGPIYAAPSVAYEEPFAQYFPAVLDPPPGSDLMEEWEIFVELGRRLGHVLEIATVGGEKLPIDPDHRPTSDELLEMSTRGSRIPFDEVKRHEDGGFFPGEPLIVQPKDEGWTGRFDLGNPDMMADLVAVDTKMDDPKRDETPDLPFRLLCRRTVNTYNSSYRDKATLKKRGYNPIFMNPGDMADLGLTAGQVVEMESRKAKVRGVVESDAHLRRGTVSVSHGYGMTVDGNPDESSFNVNALLGAEGVVERYSGQPLMSNVPVAIRAPATP